MKYLVTGGTGFLGRHLVRQLLHQKGAEVRVLARQKSRVLEKKGAQFVKGSILDPEAREKALHGVEVVFHLAGRVVRGPDASAELMRLHVDGTRLLIEDAAKAGAQRVVYASTSGTVGVSKDPKFLGTDDSPYPLELVKKWPYYLSKVYAEKAALEAAARTGLAVVIARPSLLLGPGDLRLSSTGDVLKLLRREIPVVPAGGLSFVDVRDVAVGLELCAAKGRPGQAYLMTAQNCTMNDFFRQVSEAGGVPVPWVEVSGRPAVIGAELVETAVRLLGARPTVDAASVDMALHYWYVDDAKARQELGFVTRDPTLTLRDTVEWLRKRFGAEPRGSMAGAGAVPAVDEALVKLSGLVRRFAERIK